MKKKIIYILVFLLIHTLCFSHGGYLSGQGQLKLVQTKWFDIIYPPECETSANILIQNADELCEKLYGTYGLYPYFRMPVVLTSGYESFNAYWTSYPYNHIVLFDTSLISDLSVFSQTVLSTFTHELTHAITYNMKGPFLRALGNIFGDPIATFPASLIITSGMAEGATVSMESLEGEGRLNDAYAMHNVKQAKIQNKFPNYNSVQLQSSFYPYSQFYTFNGAFAFYLQEKYGSKKYADLWYNCVNLKSLTFKNAFKKVYGTSLDYEWSEFIKAYPVPKVAEVDPVETGLANDFFASKMVNESGRVFSSLSASEKGFVYVDEVTESVFFVDWASFQNEKGVVPKKLFTKENISNINISLDGRFIVYDYFSEAKPNLKKNVAIYDIINKCFFYLNESGVEEGFIVQKDGEYYLGAKTFSSQFYGLALYKLELNQKSGKIKNVVKLWNTYFDYDVYPYSFTPIDLKNGDFAFICKQKLDYSICVWNIDGEQKKHVKPIENGLVIKSLSSVISQNENHNEKLIFSYANKDNLPSFGVFDVTNDSFSFMKQNISGGIFYPIMYENEKESKIIYSAHFYNQTKILELNEEKAEKLINQNAKTLSFINRYEEKNHTALNTFYDVKQVKLPFYKGIFFPFAGLKSLSFINTIPEEPIVYGATYITSNPWDSNNLIVQAGVGDVTKSLALQIDYTEGTATSLFSYGISGYVEADLYGFKQTYGSLNLISRVPFANNSNINLRATQFNYYGHAGFIETNDNLFVNQSGVALGLNCIKKAGPSRYENAGFSLSSAFTYSYIERLLTNENKNVFDLALSSSIYIPHLIPIECHRNFVYNFPLTVDVSAYSGISPSTLKSKNHFYYASSLSDIFSYDLFCINSELVLFGYEIQKAPSFCGLFYFDRVKVALNYVGGVNIPEEEKYDNFHIKNTSTYLKKVANGQIWWHNNYALTLSLDVRPTILGSPKIIFNASVIPDFEAKECNFSFGIKI